MEGQRDDVRPGDLTDGDRVRDREGCVDDALRAGEHLVEGGQVRHHHALVHPVGEGPVGYDGFHVRGQVVQHFEREVAEFLAILVRALDVFPRIRLEELEPEVGTDGFQKGPVGFFDCVRVGCCPREGGQVAHERRQVVVVGIGLEPEAAFERDGEGVDEVQSGQFGQQIGFSRLGAPVMPLLGVDPDVPGQVPRRLDQLRPVLAAFDVALVSAGGAEGDSQPDDKTEHRKQQAGYHELVPELRYARYDGRPDRDEGEGDDHPRCDAPSHAEEVGHLPVLFDVEGLADEVVDGAGVAAGRGPEPLVRGGRGLAQGGRFGRARAGVRVHGDAGGLLGRVGREGGGGGARVEGCCCGHGGWVYREVRVKGMIGWKGWSADLIERGVAQ